MTKIADEYKTFAPLPLLSKEAKKTVLFSYLVKTAGQRFTFVGEQVGFGQTVKKGIKGCKCQAYTATDVFARKAAELVKKSAWLSQL